MSFPSAGDMWTFIIAPKLPVPLSYVPLVFRVLALLLALPFAVGVALDLIAYAIARTLHISASSLRVPRSPQRAPRELEEYDWGVPSAFTSGLDSRQLSPKKAAMPLPASNSTTGRVSRALQLLGVGAALLAVFLQWFSVTHNASAQSALRLAYTQGSAEGSGDALPPPPNPTALVLTAHPDDEVMFFAPTILNLVADGWDICAICLSEGNADGLGNIRSQELYESYLRLGVASENVTVVDNPELQDGMSAKWDPQLIANIVGPYIADHRVTHLITFDATGITRHPNHIALAEVYPLLSPRPRLLELQSPSVATKFTGPFWSLVLAVRDVMRGPRGPRASQSATSSAASASTTTSAAFKQIETDTPPAPRLEVEIAFVASPAQYIAAVRAMLAHSSQLVWFRWLYVAFSHLMWVNELRDASHPLVVA